MTDLSHEVTLYYQNGTSDKVYKVRIVKGIPGIYWIYTSYGRRESCTLTDNVPVMCEGEALALKRFYDIIFKKKAKGYTSGLIMPSNPLSPDAYFAAKSLKEVTLHKVKVPKTSKPQEKASSPESIAPLETGRRIKDID